uniref:Uncharacterized protein n=1 Tax=Kwoniella bestiolae CBS 10118 TaxID=1296100 RepID=A0A1B9G8T7_9TREE|nr:hypothetical protein I302_02242 [Kwoniella bestiolae CBS 10118]OCF27400.1 hypothetical protein I302_02242 [Kwoniella bestiolae CBS 10118]
MSLESLPSKHELPESHDFKPTLSSCSLTSSSPTPSLIFSTTRSHSGHSSFEEFDIDKQAVEAKEFQSVMGYNKRRYPNCNRDLALSLGYKLQTAKAEDIENDGSDNPYKIKVEPSTSIKWGKIPISDIPFGDEGRTMAACGAKLVQEIMHEEAVYECKGKVMMRRTEKSRGRKRDANDQYKPKTSGKVDKNTSAQRKPKSTRTATKKRGKSRVASKLEESPFWGTDHTDEDLSPLEPIFELSLPRHKTILNGKRTTSKSSALTTQTDETTDSDKTLISDQLRTFQSITLIKIQNANIRFIPAYHYTRATIRRVLPSPEYERQRAERARAKLQERQEMRGRFPDLAIEAIDMYVKNYGEKVGMERFEKWLEFEREFYNVEYTVDMAIKEKRRRSSWFRKLVWY